MRRCVSYRLAGLPFRYVTSQPNLSHCTGRNGEQWALPLPCNSAACRSVHVDAAQALLSCAAAAQQLRLPQHSHCCICARWPHRETRIVAHKVEVGAKVACRHDQLAAGGGTQAPIHVVAPCAAGVGSGAGMVLAAVERSIAALLWHKAARPSLQHKCAINGVIPAIPHTRFPSPAAAAAS